MQGVFDIDSMQIPEAHEAITKAMIVNPQPDAEARRLKVVAVCF